MQLREWSMAQVENNTNRHNRCDGLYKGKWNKTRMPAWISHEILHQIHKRDILLKRLSRNTQDEQLWQQFKRVQTKVSRDIIFAKAGYFRNKAEEHRNEPKKLWQYLKSIGYISKPQGCSNVVLTTGEAPNHDTSKIVNHFNSFFMLFLDHLQDNSLNHSTQKLTFSKITTETKEQSEADLFSIMYVLESFRLDKLFR